MNFVAYGGRGWRVCSRESSVCGWVAGGRIEYDVNDGVCGAFGWNGDGEN